MADIFQPVANVMASRVTSEPVDDPPADEPPAFDPEAFLDRPAQQVIADAGALSDGDAAAAYTVEAAGRGRSTVLGALVRLG